MRREQRKRRNSFRDMLIVVFVVLVCFGLTIYGIVYLTGKIFGGEERVDNVSVASDPITSNPDDGDVIIYSGNESLANSLTDNFTPYDIEGGVRSEKYPNIIERPAPANVPSGVTPPPAQSLPVTESPMPAKAQNEPAAKPERTAPVKKPADMKKPEPKTVVASKGDYIVQIMAVKSESAAQKEAEKYRNICGDVFVQRADLKDKGVWYRIRCGANSTKAGAEEVKRKLEASFDVKPTVVPNR